jgi:hypothetical protein
VSHLCGGQADLQRAVSNVRITETRTLMEVVIGLAKKESSSVVNAGAMQLLTEWLCVAGFGLAIVEDDIDLVKCVVDTVRGESTSQVDIYVIFVATLIIRASTPFSSSIVAAVGPVELYKRLVDIEKRYARIDKTSGLPKVDTVDFIKIVFPATKAIVLGMCFPPLADTGDNIVDLLHVENRGLREDLDLARTEIIQFHRLATYGASRLVEDQIHHKTIIGLLRQEIEISSSELHRVELARHAEVTALKKLIDEQESQINALVSSYNQLNELAGGGETAGDSMELLREIRTRFPETASLLDPVGINHS